MALDIDENRYMGPNRNNYFAYDYVYDPCFFCYNL